jgi:ATP-dependent exoDNAse (exonuclease V) beta subunit
MESVYELRNIINSKRNTESKCKAILQTIGYPSLSVKTFDDMDNETLLSQLSSAIDSCKHQESSVYVGTIHSVKGLEFDVVFMPDTTSHRHNGQNYQVYRKS